MPTHYTENKCKIPGARRVYRAALEAGIRDLARVHYLSGYNSVKGGI